jgi:BirA family transcriptional regulator, biotin operon repressor / biotin---[acetyl-CoA-carboxylase] ligase
LQMATPDITREILFPKLATALVEELDIFANGSGFPLTRQRWLARAAHLGRSIRVRQGDISLEGVFHDIDPDGRLLLETSGGLARFDAGDVFPLDK